MGLEIWVLADNNANSGFEAEHGLSFLIKCQGEQLLFDTGQSDLFMRNAQRFGIDLNRVSTVVLSHGHWDHGNGLKYLERKTLICHPEVFQKRYRKGGAENIGLEEPAHVIRSRFTVKQESSFTAVFPNVYFLGSIPRKNTFEAKTSPFVDKNGEPDFVPDDSGLAIVLDNRLVVVSGCAHAGICNMVEHARKSTGIFDVEAVIGGFHLKHANLQLQKTIDYFSEIKVGTLYPCHCTSDIAVSHFSSRLNTKKMKAGLYFGIC